MTAGVCVPQCESECVSCVSDVNECYCVRGETPPPSTQRSLSSQLLTAATSANLKRQLAFNVALLRRHQQETLTPRSRTDVRNTQEGHVIALLWYLLNLAFYRQSHRYSTKFYSLSFTEDN